MSIHLGFEVVWESPACKTHLTSEELEARQEVEAGVSGLHLLPACWSWPLPPVPEEPLGDYMRMDVYLFVMFHDGRCAICGITPAPVQDHDHSTGMVRGYLCRGCNVQEGVSAHPLFQRYRARNPASILRVQLPYSGYGWVEGVPVGGWASHGHGPGRVPREPAWADNAATALDL
jgi:hypothetical protein